MAVDIGSEAITRANYSWGSARTVILKENPATESGTITSVEMWTGDGLTGCKVGIFYKTNATTLKCRSAVTIGDAAAGAKRTFPVSLAVVSGDYIGIWTDAGNLWRDTTGYAGLWYVDPDRVSVGAEDTYSLLGGDTLSLGGYLAVSVDYERSLSTAIGLVPVLSPQKGLLRTFTTEMGLVAVLSPQKDILRGFSTEIGLVAALSSVYGWVRLLTATIGLDVSLSAQKDLLRGLPTEIGLVAVLDESKELFRTFTTQIALVATVSPQKNLFRSFATAIGLVPILSAQKDLLRTLSTAIGLSVALSVSKQLLRCFVSVIGLHTLLRWTTSARRRIASVGDNRTVGSVGTNRELKTTGENRDREAF